jgi:deoxycytidylate deaminase
VNEKNYKRKNYINWDEYFMAIAKLSAMRSKDPSTQVGACIVSDDNRILSSGVKYSKINVENGKEISLKF